MADGFSIVESVGCYLPGELPTSSVYADRESEILGVPPDRHQWLVVNAPQRRWCRRNEGCPHPQGFGRVAHFGNCVVGRLKGKHSDTEQSLWVGGAVLGEPAVVCPRRGCA